MHTSGHISEEPCAYPGYILAWMKAGSLSATVPINPQPTCCGVLNGTSYTFGLKPMQVVGPPGKASGYSQPSFQTHRSTRSFCVLPRFSVLHPDGLRMSLNCSLHIVRSFCRDGPQLSLLKVVTANSIASGYGGVSQRLGRNKGVPTLEQGNG